jgi:uncharacterized protein YcfL
MKRIVLLVLIALALSACASTQTHPTDPEGVQW